ncbi:MAG: 4Fe-4S binding protein [Spirochaetaceae bacterium]|nr:4Fe-4S binding protein [Spirochaetaceae bacterium]
MSEARRTVIAVASGKGGTGKTTVAAHLAVAAALSRKTILVDLDVEAPDSLGYFPKASPTGEPLPAMVLVPRLDESKCSGCGLCAKTCRFGAIVAIGGVVTVDERICKGCGRCVAACPASALGEAAVEVGAARAYESGGLSLLEGRMAVGDIRSTAVIEAAKRAAASTPAELEIRDCPPGVSCSATHAIEGADCVVLVAEPTEFSLHDLGAAVELARGQGLPVGVVVNKDGFGSADVDAFCASRGVPIIGRIAFLRARAASGAATRLWSEDGSLMREMDSILARAVEATKARMPA